MKVFSVNKEFGVGFSSTTFYLQEGDLVWVNSKNGNDYIYRVETTLKDFNGKESKYNFNVPINLSIQADGFNRAEAFLPSSRYCHVEDLIQSFYITDITIQYNRDVKINELWKNLKVGI